MRQVILGLAVSLDGFIEGPNGEYDWCLPPDKEEMTAFMNRVDALFIGRKTYEMAAGHGGGGFSKMEQYVFSNTLDKVKKGCTLVSGDVARAVKEIKNRPGKDIWLFGGASLTGSLINLGLVDEFWLAIHPIVLGGGKPLFQNIKNRVGLTLVDSKVYPSGLVSLTYQK